MLPLAYLLPEVGQERARAIWRGILQFANTSDWSDRSALANLTELLLRCTQENVEELVDYDPDDAFPEMASESRLPMVSISGREVAPEYVCALLISVDELRYGISHYPRSSFKIKKTFEEWLPAAAAEHQPNLKKLLTWLSAHKKYPESAHKKYPESAHKKYPELKTEAIRFLNSANDIRSKRIEEGPTFDKKDFPFFYYATRSEYGTIAAPICAFISRGLDRFHDSHKTEADFKQAVPFHLCERPSCGKFTLPLRMGRKRFCSVECRVRAFHKSPEKWNAYMRKYYKDKKAREAAQKKHKKVG